MDLVLPRETSEFIPVPVYRDDVISTNFDVALTRWPARPASGDWSAAAVVGGLAGVNVASLTHGTWQVWVRVGTAVVPAGTIWVD